MLIKNLREAGDELMPVGKNLSIYFNVAICISTF